MCFFSAALKEEKHFLRPLPTLSGRPSELGIADAVVFPSLSLSQAGTPFLTPNSVCCPKLFLKNFGVVCKPPLPSMTVRQTPSNPTETPRTEFISPNFP